MADSIILKLQEPKVFETFITENMKLIPKSENEQIPKTAQPKVRLFIKIR